MNPMTKAGESLLREELSRLKREERPKIIDAIATAREFGDLKKMLNTTLPKSNKV